ncbi:hypothetical protein Q8W71_18935 [Methylobacterium sp. NEAU 140]|uniref:hypothetical protein n=1 Tax=Methylobacterium sp. NEAU 140 TaxID=3064945 RepID=UPI0027342562|nr:hypothetical protein [Methylobacterium sp. NEAU 140]MDP4024707.1 hypothetical protein [Methylobacterium sp. NEAU 140]
MSTRGRTPRGTTPRGLIPAVLAGLLLRRTGAVPVTPARADAPDRPAGPGHETEDVNVRNTALAMAGLAGAALVAIGIMIWLMGAFAASQRAALPTLTPQQTARLRPPPPHLQPDPYADLDRERASAERALSAYGYLDPARTRARIPIDRAMQLSVGRPLDAGAR